MTDKTAEKTEKINIKGSKRVFAITLALGAILLLCFALFSFLVISYDVQNVGFENSPIGFATINKAFHNMFPADDKLYDITQFLGYLALGLALMNGVLALADLIKSKSLFKMKKRNIIICFYYGVVVALYVLFEVVVLNFRPIEAEASYPSSHTLLALTVFYSQILMFRYSSKKVSFSSTLFSVLLVLFMIVMILGRLLCGVHWLTDIIGSVILSMSLMAFLRAFLYRFDVPVRQ